MNHFLSKIEESLEIGQSHESCVCSIKNFHPRGNFFEVCDSNFLVRAHFVGNHAYNLLRDKI